MKISKLLPLIGFLLVALICNAQKPRYIITDNFEGVAFPLIPRLRAEDVKNEFMPSVKDIMKLEKKISDSLSFIVSAYMKSESLRYTGGRYELQCDIIENLKKYKRQYTGFIINGEKMIIIRFYLYPQGNWKEEILGPSENSGCVEFLIYYEVGCGKLFNFFTDLSPM